MLKDQIFELYFEVLLVLVVTDLFIFNLHFFYVVISVREKVLIAINCFGDSE